MIVCAGTAYLGLDKHPAMLALVKQGLDKYGMHYGGSRLSALAPGIHTEAEAALCAWTGAPAALLVSSGTAAGQLVARQLAHRQADLQAGPLTHPALWWPGSTHHTDWGAWAQAIVQPNAAGLSDGIDPLGVELPPWPLLPLAAVSELVVDDSHLLGCYGAEGAGSWPRLSAAMHGQLWVTGSLGKALSLPAGVVLGSVAGVDALKAMPQFGGASPPPPAFLYAWLHAEDIIRTQQKTLADYVAFVQSALAGHSAVRIVPGFPVIGLRHHAWVDALADCGIIASSFHYPSAQHPRYSRLVLHAALTAQDVQHITTALVELCDAETP